MSYETLGDPSWRRDDGFVMRTTPATARLIALRRNRIRPMPRVAPLRVADLEIDALNPLVRQGTREIRLSPTEHIILYTVAARAGAVVSYRDLADALGRTESDVRNNTLARHFSSLRRKLGDDAHRPRYVETVLGVGYRLVSARKP
jgi:DNA-binding response OmpR family regulator